jgi:hypothetical protein
MKLNRVIALILLGLTIVLWQFESDVIELIVRQRAVLFGRWSESHFGALLVLTLILVFLAWLLWPSRPLREQLIPGAMIVISTTVTIIVVFYVSHWFATPRYLEHQVTFTNAQGVPLTGTVRHRPPNRVYEFDWSDEPERARSYPDAPPGYGTLAITLTSDNNGFRNRDSRSHYDMVLVGDSFAVGSNVSDDDVASELLIGMRGRSIYNLGASGADPGTYFVNFASYVDRLTPDLAIFMIYEGNDFKDNVALRSVEGVETTFDPGVVDIAHAAAGSTPVPQTFGERFKTMFVSSPATLGLERLSEQVFERIGADRPVPGYHEHVGWMPLEIRSGNTSRHYSFEPRRLAYLDVGEEEFSSSMAWTSSKDTLGHIASFARDREIEVLFVYVPSKPHVVMPLARESIPAQQLLNFARYADVRHDDADVFKARVYANLDSQENVFMSHCESEQWHCMSLTQPLQSATSSGQQTYFTYDQHWTPEGNRVAAETIARWLSENGW